MTKRLLLLVPAACLLAQTPPAAPKVSGLPAGLYAVFHTSAGLIAARLYEKETPRTVRNFVALAQGGRTWRDAETGNPVKRPLYNDITFHRIVKGVMIQSGDPTGTGKHNCGVVLQDEILPGLTFNEPGRLAMANMGAPDTGGCQFFLTGAAMYQWSGSYTIFGAVVSGQDVVDAISRAPADGDRPVDPVKLTSVTIHRLGGASKAKKPKD
jgi:peptidyl-prolyl cis-trans isomerase A (cyclophilin A)